MLNDLKALSALTTRFLKAIKTYINGIPKASGNFMMKYIKKLSTLAVFRNPFSWVLAAFGNSILTSISTF